MIQLWWLCSRVCFVVCMQWQLQPSQLQFKKGNSFLRLLVAALSFSPWDSSKFALYLMPCSTSTNLDGALFRCYFGLCKASLANNSTICEGTSVKQQAAPCLFRSHRRVDSLQDGNQQLDLETELGDALTLMRSNLLGY